MRRGVVPQTLLHQGPVCTVQAGEDADLAKAVTVDIARLFSGVKFVGARELSLTGSHTAAQRTWPNRGFAAGAPMFNIDPALAAEAAAANATIPVPDGFDQQGRWVGGVRGTAVGGGLAGGPGFMPSTPLQDWTAGSVLPHRRRLVVTLQPSEIRTFELKLQHHESREAEQ